MTRDGADHERAVSVVIAVGLIGLVGLAALVVVAAAVGIMVYLVTDAAPPPDDEWAGVGEITPQEPIPAGGIDDAGSAAGVAAPVSPLLDGLARTRVAAAGLPWDSYQAIVDALEEGSASQARELLAALPAVAPAEPVQEELGLLRIAADVGHEPVGTVATRMSAWRQAYPESRLSPYSRLVDALNCVADARQQEAAEGAAADAGDVTLALCVPTLDELGRRTATDPHVAGRALYELGYAYRNLDQPHEALGAWGRLSNELPGHPRTPAAVYAGGNLAWAEERHDEAAAWFGTHLERYPDDPKHRTVEYNRLAVQLVGQPAPELQADHWIGTPTTLAGHRGEVVLLLFWNEWCLHCHDQFPRVQQLQDRYGEQGLTVLLVTKHNKEQTDEKVGAFLLEHDTLLPCAVEPEGFPTSADYAVYGVPTAAVVGRDGTVVWRNHPIRLTDDAIEALLAR